MKVKITGNDFCGEVKSVKVLVLLVNENGKVAFREVDLENPINYDRDLAVQFGISTKKLHYGILSFGEDGKPCEITQAPYSLIEKSIVDSGVADVLLSQNSLF